MQRNYVCTVPILRAILILRIHSGAHDFVIIAVEVLLEPQPVRTLENRADTLNEKDIRLRKRSVAQTFCPCLSRAAFAACRALCVEASSLEVARVVVECGDVAARKADSKSPERGRSIKTLSQVANIIFDDVGIRK